MRKYLSILLACLIFSIPKIILAQNLTGTLNGTISDKKTGELLGGIIVFIDSTSAGTKGTASDFDGNYSVKGIPAGTYHVRFSGINYKTQLIQGVTITAGKITPLNLSMDPSAIMDTEVVIHAFKMTNTEIAGTDTMHHENKAVNVVGGKTIEKGQDPNAAEVLKRVPGVTIIENRFIMVRGLNERYNSVWLNDAGAPSMETDKRSFSFDMVPSGLIDRIMVYKTPSPELPADFAGGMVKIYTKAFPEKTYVNISYQSCFRAGTTGKTFYSTDGSSSGKFGFDNGSRDVPAGTPVYVSKNNPQIESITKSFHNDWGINGKNALPDQRFSVMYAQPVKFKNGFTIGNTFGVSYSNIFTTNNIHRQDWDDTAQVSDYTDLTSTQTVRSNAIENFSMMYKNNKFEFKNLINDQGRNWVTQRESNYLAGPNEKSYVEGYENRLIYSSQLVGDHKSKNSHTEYTWTAGFAYTERNAPDLKRIKYTKQRNLPDSMYSAQIANTVDPVNGGGRFFALQNERVYSFNQNFRHSFYIGKDTTKSKYHFDLNVGSYAEYKSRQFIARVLGYTISPGQLAFDLKRLPIDQIFADENLGTQGKFKMDEITAASDKYMAQNMQFAGYAMVDVPVGKKIKIDGGVRYEYNKQSLQSYVNLDSISPEVMTKYFLPSVNTTYNFNDKSLIRFAYGKTLNRPEFREWSPFYFYDFDFNAGTYGSLFPSVLAEHGQVLKVAQVDNYDCRFEFYPGLADYFQVGVFYKSFVNPIQEVVLVSGGSDSKAFSFTNADYAFTEGVEFDMRKNLDCFDTLFHTKFFGNFSAVANFSLIKSRLYISNVINQAGTNPLQGQSPYVVNGGLYYQNDSVGLQASLLYNVFGPRLFLVGTLDYPNIGELPFQSLDISFSQKVWKSFYMTFAVQNLLDQSVVLVQDTNIDGKFSNNGSDKEIMRYQRGRYFMIGIKLKLSAN